MHNPTNRMEENKMSYNAQNYKEEEKLPINERFKGTIINIEDGKIKDFVTSDKWEGNKENKAINTVIEIIYKNDTLRFEKIFTYREEEGITKYNEKSNLGRYHKKYDKLPEVGDQIMCLTNKEGYLMIDMGEEE